jgi:heme-degrading monooxygenase HmoA
MIITVFRSRVNEANARAYGRRAAELSELAASMPGHISHTTFVAPDGERCTVVEFEDEASHRAWAEHPTHRAAMEEATSGDAAYYTEYDIKIGPVERSHSWSADQV